MTMSRPDLCPNGFHLAKQLSRICAGDWFPRAKRPPVRAALRCFPFAFFCLAFPSACYYCTAITPNVPARLLCGPAVKKS
jgi:hypothetical protein